MASNLQNHLQSTKQPALLCTNRTISKGNLLSELGAKLYENVPELAQNSDIIFLSLSDDSALCSVASQILTVTSLTSKIIVDTSTVHPDTTSSVSSQFSEAGALYVAAPVFGATPVAIQGRLLFALAGPHSAIDAVKPYIISCLGRTVIFVSTSSRDASLLKTTGNFITAAMAETLSEAHVFATQAGLSNDVLNELIKENYGTYAHNISEKLITGAYAPSKDERPQSDLTLAIKDVDHGIESAKSLGLRLKIAELTMEHLREAKEWGDGQGRWLDSSAVYGVVRREAGLEFETEIVKARNRKGA